MLDTQTKGTGATMVPLERILRKPGSDTVPGFVVPKRKPPPAPDPPTPREPRAFKLVEVMTRRILGEDVDARGAVNLLGDVRSIVDVEVFVWEPTTKRWRMLTLGETQALWEYQDRPDEVRGADPAQPSQFRGRTRPRKPQPSTRSPV